MINLLENKVLGPMILQAEESGRVRGLEQGMQQGMQQGMHTVLFDLLSDKFGPLPDWAIERLQSASLEDLQAWAKRILHETTLESTLAKSTQE